MTFDVHANLYKSTCSKLGPTQILKTFFEFIYYCSWPLGV